MSPFNTNKQHQAHFAALALTFVVLGSSPSFVQAQSQQRPPAQAQTQKQQQQAQKQALLKRLYQTRMQLDRERQMRDNEARSNSLRREPVATRDAPTVNEMRSVTYQQLSRMEQNFRCLDVDVNAQGGNTVIICGGNSGDITGTNTTAGRDINGEATGYTRVPLPPGSNAPQGE